MIAALLGLLAAGLAVAAGAPWWAVAGGVPFLLPGRVAPALGAVAIVALLPWEQGAPWRDLAALLAGVLAGWAVLHRVGHAVPWVAVPWWLAGLVALHWLWGVAPPAGYWSGSDVSLRLRILTLAAAAAIGMAVSYLPRYRNESPPLGASAGGGGTTGGRDDMR